MNNHDWSRSAHALRRGRIPSRDRRTLVRRELLAALGAGVGAAVAACGGSSTSPTATNTTTSTAAAGTVNAACAVSPTETRGPYPDTTGMINKFRSFSAATSRKGRRARR